MYSNILFFYTEIVFADEKTTFDFYNFEQVMIFHKVRTFICCAWLYMHVECVNVEVGNVIDLFKNYGVLSKILPFQYDEEFVDTEFSQNLFSEREALNQYR